MQRGHQAANQVQSLKGEGTPSNWNSNTLCDAKLRFHLQGWLRWDGTSLRKAEEFNLREDLAWSFFHVTKVGIKVATQDINFGILINITRKVELDIP